MPAKLPGSSDADNLLNPDDGVFVTFDSLSGPKGSPLDAKVFDYTTGTPPGWDLTTRVPILVANEELSGCSTGGLSTGIGYGGQVIGQTPQLTTAPAAIFAAGFDDNMIPGVRPTFAAPPPPGVVSAHDADSTYLYIGGGRMIENTGTLAGDIGRPFIPDPYTAGICIVGAGEGVDRDGGAGPTAFTGFPIKTVTATGAVAEGAAIEAGVLNVSGQAMVSGQSAFGSVSTPLAAAS